jgi:DNA polymerase-4
MERRLLSWGVTTTQQYCELSVERLSQIWASKLAGRIWWGLLRGDDFPQPPTRRRTVGHSRVLPPAMRHETAARGILLRLTEKAATRLRHIGYWAGSLDVGARYLGAGSWSGHCRLSPCQDTPTLLQAASEIWERRPAGPLLQVSMVLSDLTATANVSPSLWPTERKLTALSHVMDNINQQYGGHTAYFAALHGLEHEARTAIAFTNIPDLDLADA